MKTLLLFALFIASSAFAEERIHVVTVPKVTAVNASKQDFIRTISDLSGQLFPSSNRSAVAPFGGVKLTPFLELDLTELVIVTNSYSGTAADIEAVFSKPADLKRVLEISLRNGSMSTSDVLAVTEGAQILARLKLELGVTEVTMSHWAQEKSVLTEKDFADRTLQGDDEPVATVFEFSFKGKPSRLVFVSSYIHSDSDPRPGFPELLTAFTPAHGFNWAYLSADGLGHFSANTDNGLNQANEQLLSLLQAQGAVLLDYPTDKAYHTTQDYCGISFMNGRRNLEELGLKKILSVPLDHGGVFGYCLHPGDEVRVYQKTETTKLPSPVRIKSIGARHRWRLN